MGMHSVLANVDRFTHAEAQEWQKTQMAARGAFHSERLEKSVAAGDRRSLHQKAANFRGPEDEAVDCGRWLSAECAESGIGPTERELNQYEAYWLKRLKVADDDEVRERKVKTYARDRWTLDALFADAGIPLPGPQLQKSGAMPTVQKAFTTSTTQVLFPFYYAAGIQAGILQQAIVDRLIMEDIPVNSHTVDHASMQDNAGDRGTARSSEGASGTQVIIRATNHPVTLKFYKSKALATYAALRLQRLPIFERGLMRVGQQFMIDITDECIDVLVSGDGTTGSAPTYPCGASAAPVYKDIVSLDTTFPQGYEVEAGVWIMPVEQIRKVVNMAEFKDPLAGWHYQNDGAYPTPIGKSIYRWDASGKVSGYAATTVMQVKAGIAIVKYTEGGLLIETDRVIDAQWEQVITSTWTGFGRWDANGVVVGTSF